MSTAPRLIQPARRSFSAFGRRRGKDYVFKVYHAGVRATFVDCTRAVDAAASAWHMSPGQRQAWGKAATATALYAAQLRYGVIPFDACAVSVS